MSIRITKIREALAPRGADAAAWRKLQRLLRSLIPDELEEAETFERMGKRRPEVLKQILYERARREGWKRRAYPKPKMEAFL